MFGIGSRQVFGTCLGHVWKGFFGLFWDVLRESLGHWLNQRYLYRTFRKTNENLISS